MVQCCSAMCCDDVMPWILQIRVFPTNYFMYSSKPESGGDGARVSGSWFKRLLLRRERSMRTVLNFVLLTTKFSNQLAHKLRDFSFGYLTHFACFTGRRCKRAPGNIRCEFSRIVLGTCRLLSRQDNLRRGTKQPANESAQPKKGRTMWKKGDTYCTARAL